MKVKMGRFRVEDLWPVGVVLVAVFWVVESILDTFVFGEEGLSRTLLPAQPEELWNRGLLAVVLLVFISYAQKAISGRQKAGELRSLVGSIVESSDDAIIGQTLDGAITSWNSGARRSELRITSHPGIGASLVAEVPLSEGRNNDHAG